MNQPASKEPTMDEILSSIRQIIADDDEAAAHKMPTVKAVAPRPVPVAPVPEPVPAAVAAPDNIDPFSDEDDEVMVPLALSPEQIVAPEPDPEPVLDTVAPESVMPAPLAEVAVSDPVLADAVAFEEDRDEEPQAVSQPQWAAQPAPKAASLAQAAPMPDPDLSSDLAEELLEPATTAALRDTLGRLNMPKAAHDIALGDTALTIEGMIREMLRPMLKDWLEENLPSMVERIVAQEIERVSRGG